MRNKKRYGGGRIEWRERRAQELPLFQDKEVVWWRCPRGRWEVGKSHIPHNREAQWQVVEGSGGSQLPVAGIEPSGRRWNEVWAWLNASEVHSGRLALWGKGAGEAERAEGGGAHVRLRHPHPRQFRMPMPERCGAGMAVQVERYY